MFGHRKKGDYDSYFDPNDSQWTECSAEDVNRLNGHIQIDLADFMSVDSADDGNVNINTPDEPDDTSKPHSPIHTTDNVYHNHYTSDPLQTPSRNDSHVMRFETPYYEVNHSLQPPLSPQRSPLNVSIYTPDISSFSSNIQEALHLYYAGAGYDVSSLAFCVDTLRSTLITQERLLSLALQQAEAKSHTGNSNFNSGAQLEHSLRSNNRGNRTPTITPNHKSTLYPDLSVSTPISSQFTKPYKSANVFNSSSPSASASASASSSYSTPSLPTLYKRQPFPSASPSKLTPVESEVSIKVQKFAVRSDTSSSNNYPIEMPLAKESSLAQQSTSQPQLLPLPHPSVPTTDATMSSSLSSGKNRASRVERLWARRYLAGYILASGLPGPHAGLEDADQRLEALQIKYTEASRARALAYALKIQTLPGIVGENETKNVDKRDDINPLKTKSTKNMENTKNTGNTENIGNTVRDTRISALETKAATLVTKTKQFEKEISEDNFVDDLLESSMKRAFNIPEHLAKSMSMKKRSPPRPTKTSIGTAFKSSDRPKVAEEVHAMMKSRVEASASLISRTSTLSPQLRPISSSSSSFEEMYYAFYGISPSEIEKVPHVSRMKNQAKNASDRVNPTEADTMDKIYTLGEIAEDVDCILSSALAPVYATRIHFHEVAKQVRHGDLIQQKEKREIINVRRTKNTVQDERNNTEYLSQSTHSSFPSSHFIFSSASKKQKINDSSFNLTFLLPSQKSDVNQDVAADFSSCTSFNPLTVQFSDEEEKRIREADFVYRPYVRQELIQAKKQAWIQQQQSKTSEKELGDDNVTVNAFDNTEKEDNENDDENAGIRYLLSVREQYNSLPNSVRADSKRDIANQAWPVKTELSSPGLHQLASKMQSSNPVEYEIEVENDFGILRLAKALYVDSFSCISRTKNNVKNNVKNDVEQDEYYEDEYYEDEYYEDEYYEDEHYEDAYGYRYDNEILEYEDEIEDDNENDEEQDEKLKKEKEWKQVLPLKSTSSRFSRNISSFSLARVLTRLLPPKKRMNVVNGSTELFDLLTSIRDRSVIENVRMNGHLLSVKKKLGFGEQLEALATAIMSAPVFQSTKNRMNSEEKKNVFDINFPWYDKYSLLQPQSCALNNSNTNHTPVLLQPLARLDSITLSHIKQHIELLLGNALLSNPNLLKKATGQEISQFLASFLGPHVARFIPLSKKLRMIGEEADHSSLIQAQSQSNSDKSTGDNDIEESEEKATVTVPTYSIAGVSPCLGHLLYLDHVMTRSLLLLLIEFIQSQFHKTMCRNSLLFTKSIRLSREVPTSDQPETPFPEIESGTYTYSKRIQNLHLGFVILEMRTLEWLYTTLTNMLTPVDDEVASAVFSLGNLCMQIIAQIETNETVEALDFLSENSTISKFEQPQHQRTSRQKDLSLKLTHVPTRLHPILITQRDACGVLLTLIEEKFGQRVTSMI